MSNADAFDRVVEHERTHHRRRRWRRARHVLIVHAWVYVAVNLALIAGWVTERAVLDSQHPVWWLPTTMGWGVGLAAHASLVYRPWSRTERGPRGS